MVGLALIAAHQATEPGNPLQGAFDDVPVTSQPLGRLDAPPPVRRRRPRSPAAGGRCGRGGDDDGWRTCMLSTAARDQSIAPAEQVQQRPVQPGEHVRGDPPGEPAVCVDPERPGRYRPGAPGPQRAQDRGRDRAIVRSPAEPARPPSWRPHRTHRSVPPTSAGSARTASALLDNRIGHFRGSAVRPGWTHRIG